MLKLEDIAIVNDFLDSFLEDLPRLLLDREIEFTAYILSDTTSISKAPYHMAPAKLRKLKEQLQELLDKVFIRLSISIWEAPVLFVKKKGGSIRHCFFNRELKIIRYMNRQLYKE